MSDDLATITQLRNQLDSHKQMLAQAVRQGGDAIDELRGANAEIDYLRHLVEQADRLVTVVLSEWEELAGLAAEGASVSGYYDHLDEPPAPSLVPAMCEEWKNAREFGVHKRAYQVSEGGCSGFVLPELLPEIDDMLSLRDLEDDNG